MCCRQNKKKNTSSFHTNPQGGVKTPTHDCKFIFLYLHTEACVELFFFFFSGKCDGIFKYFHNVILFNLNDCGNKSRSRGRGNISADLYFVTC